jgi:hypothetical protein
MPLVLRAFLLSLLLSYSIALAAQPGQALPAGYRAWSATRRLQVADFQLPVRPGNNLHQSFASFQLQLNGRSADLLGKKANQFVQNLLYSAGSYFDTSPEATDSAGFQLRYWQTMWDLQEVAARRLRQQLRASARRILLTGSPDMSELSRLAYEEVRRQQTQYTDETKYALFLDKQLQWEQRIAAELTELAGYAVPD